MAKQQENHLPTKHQLSKYPTSYLYSYAARAAIRCLSLPVTYSNLEYWHKIAKKMHLTALGSVATIGLLERTKPKLISKMSKLAHNAADAMRATPLPSKFCR